jgi:hypothetical protein
MAEEAGLFTFDDIAAAISVKMLRRHQPDKPYRVPLRAAWFVA